MPFRRSRQVLSSGFFFFDLRASENSMPFSWPLCIAESSAAGTAFRYFYHNYMRGKREGNIENKTTLRIAYKTLGRSARSAK